MIPEFPQFKKLKLSDKEEVEKITSKFPSYSDFNFVSMWSWDTQDGIELSKLNSNLVVRFTDYLTSKPFFSFIGENKVNETTETLLEFAKEKGLKPVLKLIPEHSIKDLDTKRFKVKEDQDNFDYIYYIENLATLKGNKYQTHRNLINQFLKKYQNWKVDIVDINKDKHKNALLNLYKKWLENKCGSSTPGEEHLSEFLSFQKLLSIENTEKYNLTCCAVYVEDEMVGFIINEHVGNHNIIHFEKAQINYRGAYPFLMQQNAKILENLNLKYLNFEQDLGIEALKFTKNKFRPSHFLKKYLITY